MNLLTNLPVVVNRVGGFSMDCVTCINRKDKTAMKKREACDKVRCPVFVTITEKGRDVLQELEVRDWDRNPKRLPIKGVKVA